MKIAVVTDSSANLTAQAAADYKITVVNDPIMFGNHVYHENVDITTDQFYRLLKVEKEIPTISQISMPEMQVVFDDLKAAGYEQVLVIGLSSGISGYVNNLKTYAPSVKDLDVEVFDSRTACAGTANMVKLAAAMALAGYELDAIVDQLTILRATTQTILIVNSMRHLVKNGRIYNNSSLAGTMVLRNKPIMTFNTHGKLQIWGKERTLKNAQQAVEDAFNQFVMRSQQPIRLDIISANDEPIAENWASELRYRFPAVRVKTGEIGPVMGVLTGEHALGMIWSYDWKPLLNELNHQRIQGS
ncbi:DegV family protein [Lactiplantibacillus mudanjiangensis]|uniref:DegV family protein [Lactobacillus plantarum ZJ316] n=1 Tax=Lactiplantibacillus mudanjiangensis TaxID=1296538 RepID=A0A660DW11_9LACO|nr:DegV family protein [Lactiplantibacillus mudanjiangensis]VDG19022.1 DegV family protein [Lactobacillus plantarum ZJ316] [Lactiplantibacillus mudanjiangensis]VDG25512.1 DegV family protein [Lactobacillus plantarum ZJ316] [Lactiplantibacillus mudanjiangensis]VDG27541.1 DegV family protein [Lactobacillus plantarum ZJ316] [Lactiplantibacillus mudanjiangensis]VDG33116.1 DegV family protein [Lactobacillus plantarum ZJ316] [Lactiplantibacillus mudanjiangensis]